MVNSDQTGKSDEEASAHAGEKDHVLPQAVGDTDQGDTLVESPERPVSTVSEDRVGGSTIIFAALLAGGVGFLGSQYLGDSRWPFPNGPVVADELRAAILQQQTKIEELRAEISTNAETLVQLNNAETFDRLNTAFRDLNAELRNLAESTEDADLRLSVLENRPVPDIGANIQAVELYEAELSAMRDMLKSELAEITASQKSANRVLLDQADIARVDNIGALLAQLTGAAENGQPFTGVLDLLSKLGVGIPGDLHGVAETGIPTSLLLAETYPDAARQALRAAAQSSTEPSESSGLVSFLRDQLGARSLSPRDGPHPDAVLSRAESALQSGDLGAALTELQALSDVAQVEMKDWIDAAKIRLDALDMISELKSTTGVGADK